MKPYVVWLIAALLFAGTVPVASGSAPSLSIRQAKISLKNRLLAKSTLYDYRFKSCHNRTASSVRCRIHTWESNEIRDFECDVIGDVTAITRATQRTRLHSWHCYSTSA